MEVVRSRLKREDKGRSETLRLTFRIYERRSQNMHLRKVSTKAIVYLSVISFLHSYTNYIPFHQLYKLYPFLRAIPDAFFFFQQYQLDLPPYSQVVLRASTIKHPRQLCLKLVRFITFTFISKIKSLIQKVQKTRLSYICAHLRWTKKTLTIEYFRIVLKNIWVKFFLG